MKIIIDLKKIYGETARLENKTIYIDHALEIAGNGNDVVLTGSAPIWLYLLISHALHGKATRLIYDSPVTGEVMIFNHNPF